MSSQQSITFEQHFRPEQLGEYVSLPVELPPDAARLEILLQHEVAGEPVPGAPPGNVLDLGLFDPRGAALGASMGFRGWGCWARSEIYLAPDDATPGYLPGPLYPGVWQIVLGLYRLHPEGCTVQVVVRVTRGPAPAPVALTWPEPAVRPETRWYRGDLHCHSQHSEYNVTGTLAELCAGARAWGLDFIAVTEHNTISHHRLLGRFRTAEFLPIPGQEVTTYLGHGNVWGAEGWVECRCRSDADLIQTIRLAQAAGGLFSANHPKTNGPPWLFGTMAGIDCLEVWGAPWFLSNYQSRAVWDDLLRAGRRVVGVGGSDLHQQAAAEGSAWHHVGQPTTWVYAPALEQAAILGAIKAGHVFISASPQGPRLELWARAAGQEAMMGDVLTVGAGRPVELAVRVQGASGLVLRLWGPQGRVAEAPITGDDFAFTQALATPVSTYVRAEVIQPLAPEEAQEPAALLVEALSNPVYIALEPLGL